VKEKFVHLPKVFSRIVLIILAMITISFAGCPDYSHLREAPDYKNMTDSGNE